MGTENRESGNVLQIEMVDRVTIPSATEDEASAGLESSLDMVDSGGFIQKSKSLSLEPAFGNERHPLDASCSSDLLRSSFELFMYEVELGAEVELGGELGVDLGVEVGGWVDLGIELEVELCVAAVGAEV